MITITDECASVLTGSYTLYRRVESWLEGALLSDDIPIINGAETVDRSLRVPERVTLTVPREEKGYSWAPVADDAPLGTNGQRLRVLLGVGLPNGRIEWIQRGWFVVHHSEIQGDDISVDARGMLQLIDEADLISPFQPTSTMTPTLRALVEPALTISVSGVADRSVPAAVNFADSRLTAVLEMLDAWPADGVVDTDGVFTITAPPSTTGTPVMTLSEERSGTVVEVAGESTREDAFNVVVARGTASDGTQVQGVAYLTTGPKAYGSAFNPLPVPFFFNSPLLSTTAEARAAANTVLARKIREGAQRYNIEAVPHPALQTGDLVTVDSEVYSGNAVIERLTLPYVADGGSMSMTVRAV